MNTQTVSQTSSNIRQTLVRYRWAIALGLLIAVAALVAYRFTSVPAGPTRAVDRAQASLVEPAQQSVLDYLRVHTLVQTLPTPAVPLDHAQQGVMDYLRAHEHAERSPAFWDQAAQAVLDYLRAHSR
jgi:hypothetical protein